jgi:hypothetical protein
VGLPDKQPSVALVALQKAAREGEGVLVEKGRCLNTLLGLLGTFVRVQDFAEKIVAFGLEERRNYYVGLQMRESRNGGRVIVVTLHPPEWDMRCADGTVVRAEEEE